MVIHASSSSFSPPEYNVIKGIQTNITLVLVTRTDDYIFNTQLLNLKDYVLVDFIEYGWDKNITETHFFGKNTNNFIYRFDNSEWNKFDEWVKNNPPKIYFKRELLKQDVSGNVYPIDYPCYAPVLPEHDKEGFNSRPVNVFHFWGRSSEERVKIHADFWLHSESNGATICDNIYYVTEFLRREENINKWISLNIPHYARIDISNIYGINMHSKLSLSMKGCGYKCFRHSESPVNSIMVMEENDIKFAYDWIHGVNCIKYKGNLIDAIEEALKRDDLYEIYLQGLINIDKYRTINYNKYIENIITNTLY